MQQCPRTMLDAVLQEMTGFSFLLTSLCRRPPFRLLDTTELQTGMQTNTKYGLVLEFERIKTMRPQFVQPAVSVNM